eukprot:11161173-Lingulodinium_polyedra.AAC.1
MEFCSCQKFAERNDGSVEAVRGCGAVACRVVWRPARGMISTVGWRAQRDASDGRRTAAQNGGGERDLTTPGADVAPAP